MNAQDVFEEMFRAAGFGSTGGFGGMGGPFGGGGFKMGSQPVVYQINLRLEDFFHGKELNIEVKGGRKLKVQIEKGMMPGNVTIIR